MQLDIPESVNKQLFAAILPIAVEAFRQAAVRESLPFWMKKGEAARYANVDPGILRKYVKQGILRTSMKDGAERISKKAIDDMYEKFEY